MHTIIIIAFVRTLLNDLLKIQRGLEAPSDEFATACRIRIMHLGTSPLTNANDFR